MRAESEIIYIINMYSDIETEYLSQMVLTSKIHESPTDSSVIYKFTTLAEIRNYDRIQKHNIEWDVVSKPIFPVVYSTRDVTSHSELNFIFKGINKDK